MNKTGRRKSQASGAQPRCPVFLFVGLCWLQAHAVGISGSTVGSVHGNTAIVAGGHYQQSGSDVLSGAGDVSIQA